MEQQLFSTSDNIEVAVLDNKDDGTGIPKMCWEIAAPWDVDHWTTTKPWGQYTMQTNKTYWMKVVKNKLMRSEINIFCYVKEDG